MNPLDLRRWLDEVRAFGELTDVHGADWNLEIGGVSEVNVRKATHPALLFDEIPGYPKGFRILTCSTSGPRRLASILRLGPIAGHHALVQTLRGRPAKWRADASRFEPVVASSGPLMENVREGDAVDLLAFPSPFWHELDGGRYIGTGCSVVTKDPDSDWINVGTYRVMLHDRNHVGVDWVPGKHGAIHWDKYTKAGKPCPVAIVLGCDPLGYLISGIEVPFGMCEYNYIGAILSEPVSVVRGAVTGLPVPAASEIVIEGWIHPGDVRSEGPFGEFHGYYPGKAGTAPVVTVERAYYRNDPIIVGSPPAKPPNDYSYSKAVMRSALLFDALVAAGVPDVKAVWAHGGAGAYMSRYSVVVDDDIDPSNLQEVMWAVATRTDPAVDIDIIQRGVGSKNDPMFVAYQYDAALSSKAVIDACRPYDRLEEFPVVAEVSRELQEKVKAKWPELLG